VTRPVIGLTISYATEKKPACSLPGDYVDSVLLAGGLPVLLPPVDEVDLVAEFLARVDGLILTGGADIDPAEYGEGPHPKTKLLHPRRSRFELAVARSAFQKGLPVMGICLGCQVLNVALGGSLYQHVPEQIDSSLTHSPGTAGDRSEHQIRIEPGSLLARILGVTTLRANSSHHQAIKAVAPPLRPVAWSQDGVVEAAEGQAPAFLLAIQWHPENLATESPRHRALFEALVEAARRAPESPGR